MYTNSSDNFNNYIIMKKTLRILIALSLGLLLTISLENIITLGNAFNFENYTFVKWLFQILIFTLTISLSLLIAINENEND